MSESGTTHKNNTIIISKNGKFTVNNLSVQ
jgi:hypothetical protein